MFSFVGDVVLDPFLGSGTTSLAAKNLDRNSIGYEINSEFKPVITEKMGLKQKEIFNPFQVQFAKQNKISSSAISESKSKLPYLFKDTVQFNKKMDPRKLQFGSKIDDTLSKREDFHKVTQILSSNTIVLDDKLTVKLLGVEEDPATTTAAIDFLDKKTKGQKVFMKFDTQKYDADNNLLCYLYLQNKTFLNAHLIKNGLAKATRKQDYKYKTKFITEWSKT
jgi:site-specific DNA-methyltransferase (adenine-specific)